jgi:tetraacyldisaccharide 4'-kinase
LGLRPAILSRGYRASSKHGSESGNDEFRVLQANIPQVPCFEGSNRYASGLKAVAQGANIILLDDGFQHVRLARDLNVALLDALCPFGGGRVLPAGLLREPLSALAHANLFAITRCDVADPRLVSTLASYLRARFPRIPQARVAAHPIDWVSLSGSSSPPESLKGKKAFVFCGIGNPEAFRRQVLGLGLELSGFLSFRDHHEYSFSDIERIRAQARVLGADEVLMTQKDAVKIALRPETTDWKYLKIECCIVSGKDAYLSALTGLIREVQRA